MLPGQAFLGLALGERTIVAAEVRIHGDRSELRRAGEFEIPPELSMQAPQPLGDALRHFLRLNHFSASRVVIGVPARWLMAQEKEIPPATAAVAASALRLQAERQVAMEPQDLVFDYAGEADSAKSRKVLLVAMLQQQLQRIEQMAAAAGLNLLAVTSSTLALAQASNSAARGPLLSLTNDGVELTISSDGRPHMLRHLPSIVGATLAAEGPAFVGGEIRRAMALMPQNGGPVPKELQLWDAVGMPTAATSALAERAGLEVRGDRDLTSLGVSTTLRTTGSPTRFAAGTSLALAGGRRELLAFDFLHSRLAVRKARRFGRGAAWGAVAAAVLLGAGTWLGLDIHRQSTELARLQNYLAENKQSVTEAQETVDKVSVADEWYTRRSVFLDCLKEITQAFPEDGRIWATNLTLREAPKTPAANAPESPRRTRVYAGTLVGKAVDDSTFTTVYDRLLANRKFSIDFQNKSKAGNANTSETSFTISFSFPTE